MRKTWISNSKYKENVLRSLPESMAFEVHWCDNNKHIEVVNYDHSGENCISLLYIFGYTFSVVLVNNQDNRSKKRAFILKLNMTRWHLQAFTTNDKGATEKIVNCLELWSKTRWIILRSSCDSGVTLWSAINHLTSLILAKKTQKIAKKNPKK